MDVRIHIPKIEELALYAACDEISQHGVACLTKPMNRPLYYRCIITYDEKHSRFLSRKKLYDIHRSGGKLALPTHTCMTLSTAVCILDHVILTAEDTIRQAFIILIKLSDDDVDLVIECLHRFASRCMAAGKHEFMMNIMTTGLIEHFFSGGCSWRPWTPCKAIREVLIQHGAVLQQGSWTPHGNSNVFPCSACAFGMTEILERILPDGSRATHDYLVRAVSSGDTGTIKLVSSRMRGKSKLPMSNSYHVNAGDLTLDLCKLLVECQIVKISHSVVTRYHFTNIRSVEVLKWLLENSLVYQQYVNDIFHDAVSRGGPYVDALHYLVEEAHLKVPADILLRIAERCDRNPIFTADLFVVDYLIHHGADVNATYEGRSLMTEVPGLRRYWLDNGFKVDKK